MSESVEVAAPAVDSASIEVPSIEVPQTSVSSSEPHRSEHSSDANGEAGPASEGSDQNPSGFMQLMRDTLGDESSDLDAFTAGLKKSHINDFSPEARQTMKNMLRAFKSEGSSRSEALNERERILKEEASVIDDRARGLHAQRAALLKMMRNPDIEKNANDPGISDDDLMTPEGQRKYLEHLTAKQWKNSLEPLQQTTKREAQALAYQKWASDKPEMRNDDFRGEMKALIENRRTMNLSLTTSDAYEIVKARQSAAKAEASRSREHAVRAASARQIGRGTGTAEVPKTPPKKGGAAAIAKFIKANPDYKYRGRRSR